MNRLNQNLTLKTDWMQRLEQAPPGTLVHQGKSEITVMLTRRPKENHWRFWIVIVGTTVLGFESGLGAVITGFFVSLFFYFCWWRSRRSVVFCKNRLVVRNGIGIFGPTTELRYEGLECEFEAGEISLFNFNDNGSKSVVFPGNPWLFRLIENAAQESEVSIDSNRVGPMAS